MSVTTWILRGVAFWPRTPLPHSLRSPVSKSALKMILAEAEPTMQSRTAETAQERLSRVFDVKLRSPSYREASSILPRRTATEGLGSVNVDCAEPGTTLATGGPSASALLVRPSGL